MKNQTPVFLALALTLAAGCLSYRTLSPAAASVDPTVEVTTAEKPKKTMRPFTTEKELKDYLTEQSKRNGRDRGANTNSLADASIAADGVATKEAQPASKDDRESITNTQHAGVD